MRALLWITVALLSLRTGLAASLSPFAYVMIDSQTEAMYGGLPFNRTLIAKAVDRLMAANAKGVVIKFFYDLPSTEKSDEMLELSICRARVALQASLNDVEGTTNSLDAKFGMVATALPEIPAIFAGERALLPLPRFSHCASAVGFVDSTATDIPLVEQYQGKVVKSLFLVALEMASDQKAQIEPAGVIKLGDERLEVMHSIDFSSTNSVSYNTAAGNPE